MKERRARLWIVAAAAAALLVYGFFTRHGPALADEFVYLAGAKHFARTGSLDARFYDAMAILRQGHPHQDVHPPGYAVVLGLWTALLPDGYWTAVALNAVLYAVSALLVRELARALGASPNAALASALLFLALPPYLPFVFWVMPEILLGTLVLASLVLAVRRGETTGGAVAAALVLALGVLVRETAALAAVAVATVLWPRRKMMPFLATLGAVVLLVHVPLSRHRAPGGVNFWTAEAPRTPGQGFAALQRMRGGQVAEALDSARRRVASNARWFGAATRTEQGILVLYAAVVLAALAARPEAAQGRRVRAALVFALAFLLVAILLLFVITRWSGFRYLMFLLPPLLPFVVAGVGPRAAVRVVFGAALAAAAVLLDLSVLGIHNEYKSSRQRRWDAVAAYVGRYVGHGAVERIVLPNGWAFGLARYPTEVISSLPPAPGHLRHLEKAIWFDYLVVPSDSVFSAESDARARYLRLNADDPEPPLKVYRRLR